MSKSSDEATVVSISEKRDKVTKQDRSSNYYKQRLKKERPDLFRQIAAGTITVNKARQLAGLGATRTRLNELQNAWMKATAKEQAEFLRWAGLIPSPVPTAPASVLSTRSAFNSHGMMASWAQRRVVEIMRRRALTTSDLADELGIKRLNVSVISAVKHNKRVKDASVIMAVEHWLSKNASV